MPRVHRSHSFSGLQGSRKGLSREALLVGVSATARRSDYQKTDSYTPNWFRRSTGTNPAS
jgi:hypothetical protein